MDEAILPISSKRIVWEGEGEEEDVKENADTEDDARKIKKNSL